MREVSEAGVRMLHEPALAYTARAVVYEYIYYTCSGLLVYTTHAVVY